LHFALHHDQVRRVLTEYPLQTFDGPESRIAFIDAGAGVPVLLIHGFGSSHTVNWVNTSWVGDLVRAGHRVVAFDNRGHGRSSKFYEPADYALARMAGDAAGLLSHLGIGRAHVLGYSMGARVAATLALQSPGLVRSLILAGMGAALVTGRRNAETVAAALEAPDGGSVDDADGRMFRQFAERTQSDLRALAACMRAQSEGIDAARLGGLAMPVLIAIGTADDVAGPIEGLAVHMPQAELLPIPGRDHNRAVGDRTFKAGVVDFLSRH
jgi:pimeloyl-ACP methyl ester carboxylesterase